MEQDTLFDNTDKKIILDLCGGTGAWSQPYKDDGGYDVLLITYPEYDVCAYKPPKHVYGILAAPPCTHFSIACNRLWTEKDENGKTIEGLRVLLSCIRVIAEASPRFWAIENPVGRMKEFLGEPDYQFIPADFGFPTKKKTYLWGKFNPPIKQKHTFERYYKVEEIDYLAPELFKDLNIIETDHSTRAAIRSVTPPGFAKAFFEANR